MLSWIGWIATACFGLSYFFKKPATLRLIQAGAALLWISYGLLIHAMPVVVANVIVALAALYSTFARKSPQEEEAACTKPDLVFAHRLHRRDTLLNAADVGHPAIEYLLVRVATVEAAASRMLRCAILCSMQISRSICAC